MIKRLLYVSHQGRFQGGVEQFMYRTSGILRTHGIAVDGLFPPGGEDVFLKGFDRVWFSDNLSGLPDDIDAVIFHKVSDERVVRFLRSRYRCALYLHDHDYTCPRRCRYDPLKRNCFRPVSPFRCTLCASLSRNAQGKIRPFNYLHFASMRRALRGITLMTQSEFMRGEWVKNGMQGSKVYLIPPPLAELPEDRGERPLRDMKEPFKLLFAGQLIPGKGADLMLEMLRGLQLNYHARIVGSGSETGRLQAMASVPELAGKVEFCGWVSSLEPFYRWADVLIFPSRWQEPFGMVGPEAFAHGVPAVAFNVGGIGAWLKEGCGRMIKAFDLEAMRQSLSEMAENPVLLQTLSRNAFASARAFSEDAFAEGVLQAIEEG